MNTRVCSAILQLVQAGRLKLDAPLGTYLTDHPNRDVATKVTIHHLLTHTGGAGNIFGPEFMEHRLLNAHDTDLLTTGKVDTGGGGKDACGFAESVAGGVRSFGHSGGAPGMNGDLQIFPQSGHVVAALANMDGAAGQITAWIAERLPK